MSKDLVNHPSHYIEQSAEGFEPIELVERFTCNASMAMKYLIRAGHKDSEIVDLRKARWYLLRALEMNFFPIKSELNSSSARVADVVEAFIKSNDYINALFTRHWIENEKVALVESGFASAIRLVDKRLDELLDQKSNN